MIREVTTSSLRGEIRMMSTKNTTSATSETHYRRPYMAKMRAVQVSKSGGPFEMVEREIPEPAPRQIRVKVQACGVCHSDSLTKEGQWPGIAYPRVPGHEIAGVIDA